uniref:Pseudouridine synthase RsuA/RluA-like domain-containing protein n=1 Tax=Ditylenchus dipsaci TaxID=166011 RepID=A0A915D262_9BILA
MDEKKLSSREQDDVFSEQYFKPGNVLELDENPETLEVMEAEIDENKLNGINDIRQLIEPVWKYSVDELVNMMSKRVIYETDDVIAFNKPPQMAYSSSTNDQAQLDRILQKLRKSVCPKVERLHLVTSLDKAISGVVLFAKNSEKQNKLKQLIDEDHALLRFRCILKGIPAEQRTRISIPLIKVVKDRDMKLSPLSGEADKKATVYKMDTDVQVVNENRQASVSLVDAFIKRGIPHLARSHLYYGINCPIIGDQKYVKKPHGSSKFSIDQIRLSGPANNLLNIKNQEARHLPLCMHLAEIHVPESRGGKFSVVKAEIPPYLHFILKKFKLLRK